MSFYTVIQYVVLSVAVLFSLWHLAGKLLPKPVHALRVCLAKTLHRKGLVSASESVQPKQAPKGGCATGCDSCKMCETLAALQPPAGTPAIRRS